MTSLNFDKFVDWTIFAHAGAGAIALLILFVPMISQKGGKLHIRAGWVYVGAMAFVGLSTFIITPWRVFFDPERTISLENFSIFLFYVAVFTLAALSYGLTSLRQKQRTKSSFSFVHLGPPLLTIFSGLAVQIIGWKSQNVLLMTFPLLGHFTAKDQLQYWIREPKEKMHWWYAHMNGMFVASIATITAFLVTAVPRIWPGPFSQSPILWVAPGVILGAVLNRWTKAYMDKYETKH